MILTIGGNPQRKTDVTRTTIPVLQKIYCGLYFGHIDAALQDVLYLQLQQDCYFQYLSMHVLTVDHRVAYLVVQDLEEQILAPED